MRTSVPGPAWLVCVALTASAAAQTPLGTAFTYQGRLNSAGTPLTGAADFQFSLWDDAGSGGPPAGGTQIGAMQTVSNVAVTGGLFAVQLNAASEFGASAFNGEARWLQIAVRSPAGSGGFTTLAPRQAITAAPYAMFALSGPGAGAGPWSVSGSSVYYASGNVGIGTTSPQARFNVNGTSWFQGDSTPLPAAAGKGIAAGFTGDLGYLYAFDYGLFQPKTLLLNHAGGNVGIGTTTPHHRLRISGGPPWTTSFLTGSLELDNGAAIGWQGNAAGQHFGILQYTGGLYIFHTASDPGTTGSPAPTDLMITDSDNVGVGTITPHHRLSVSGGPAWTSNLWAGSFELNNASAIGWQANPGGQRFGIGATSGGLYFFRSASDPGTSASPANYDVVISDAGNVGIGTITPTLGRLQVDGGANPGVYSVSSAYGLLGGASGNLGPGVYGAGSGTGGYGVYGSATGSSGIGVYGQSSGNNGYGLYGRGTGDAGYGVYGRSGNQVGAFGLSEAFDGVWGESHSATAAGVSGHNTAGGWAGWFGGNVYVGGNLIKPAGQFRIDHPLDPANKYLSHSFVESPDMKNVYDGVVTTDGGGDATITLPDWFEALNRDFRYQLTVIGQFAQAIVSREIENNVFAIKTDKPGVKVSWQVTGIRHDPYANAHRIVVQEDKPAAERGKYLVPEAYGLPKSRGVNLRAEGSAGQQPASAPGDLPPAVNGVAPQEPAQGD